MAIGANDLATLDGFFKKVYADKIEKLVPEDARLQQLVKFLPKEKMPGLNYNQPVVLGLEHGFTYCGKDGELIQLNDQIAGQVKNAVVSGYEMVLRSAIPYTMISRSATSQAAFESATKYLVGNMMDSFTKRLEVELMYGQAGIGIVKNAEADGVSVVVEILESSWAPGIWGGAEKMKVDFYSALVGGNLRNAVSGNAVISAVDFDAKTITIANLTTVLAAGLSAGDHIFPAGAYGKQMKGLHAIMNENSDLFGISPSAYSLWKATQFDPNPGGAASVLSFAIIQKAIAAGVARGLKGDVVCLVAPGHWDNLLTEQTAQRMLDSSYKTEEYLMGSKAITFYAQCGKVSIIPSIYVKEGHAYIMNPDIMARVGSLDITFNRPGFEGKFFFDLPSHNGVELRALSDQSLFVSRPGHLVLIKNIKLD